MGTTLNGTTPQNTYPSLIKVGDNGAIDATLKRLSDGNGNDLPLLVSDKSITNYGGGNINTNTAFGSNALNNNTIGSANTAIGLNSLFQNISGVDNTAIGRLSMASNTTGVENTAVGSVSLNNNTTGSNNTAIGFFAILGNTTGIENVGVGRSTLQSNTTGSLNTAIGTRALLSNISGQGNTAIGVDTSSGNFSNSVIIGRDATATANNQFVVGSASVNAGSVAAEVNTSANVWNVVINGVARKILLA